MPDEGTSAPMSVASASDLDFRRLMDYLPSPFMVMTRHYIPIYANEAYLALVHRSWEDMVGRDIFESFPEKPRRMKKIKDYFKRTLAGEKTVMDKEYYSIPTLNGGIETRCWQSIQLPYFDKDGEVTHIIQQAVDVTEEEAQRRQTELLSRELDHRVKNMFAVIQATANLASHDAQTAKEFREDFTARMISMSRTYDALSRTHWEGLKLRDIFHAELGAYLGGGNTKITMAGPDIRFGAQASQNASLLVHELATNAAKHGCFSKPEGRLHIEWEVDEAGDKIRIIWSETGLTGIREPDRIGFGTQLTDFMPNIKNVSRTYRDEGLLFEVTVTLRAIRFNPKRQLSRQVPGSAPRAGHK